MKSVTVLLVCLSLTACANFPFFSDSSWMKNPFSASTSDDSEQRGERISAEYSKSDRWFCQPNDTNTGWQCLHQKQQPAAAVRAGAESSPRSPQTEPATQADPALMTPSSGDQPEPDTMLALNEQSEPGASADHGAVVRGGSEQTGQPPPFDTTPPPESPLLEEQTPATAPDTAVKSLIETTSLNVDMQKLMALPPEFFAVQLIALDDLAEMLAYATSQGMTDPLIVRVNSTYQRPLVVLLEGIYPDKAQADQAANSWALANPKAEKPWVRKLGTLQQAMGEAARDE